MKKYLLSVYFLLTGSLLLANETKVIYYANGNKHFEYNTVNDLLNGQFISYYENGNIRMKGSFRNNQKNGVWTVWDDNGIMCQQRKYADNYSFEILKEWDSTGVLVDPVVIQAKNEQIIGARSKSIAQRQMSYLHRYWRSIPASNTGNAFLYDNNFFYNFLVTQTIKGYIKAFNEDRFIYTKDQKDITAYQHASVVNYLVKEDLIYTNDHQVMHTRLIGICPVVSVNGREHEVAWFYIPDVRNSRFATDQLEKIITKLERHQYAGTIDRTTVSSKNHDPRDVAAQESDAVNLSYLDYEASAWIQLMDKNLIALK